MPAGHNSAEEQQVIDAAAALRARGDAVDPQGVASLTGLPLDRANELLHDLRDRRRLLSTMNLRAETAGNGQVPRSHKGPAPERD